MNNRPNAAPRRAVLLAISSLLAASAVSTSAFAAGNITTVAGNGVTGWTENNVPATSTTVGDVGSLSILPDGRLIWAESNRYLVRQMTPDGIINSYLDSNGSQLMFSFQTPFGLVSDASGNMYVTEFDTSRVVKVTPQGVETDVVAFGGGSSAGGGFSGDGGPATAALVRLPHDLWRLADGTMYIADWGNRRVRKINAAGIINTVAGSGQSGSTGDGGSALAASFGGVSAVTVDAAGNLYVADSIENKIRRIGTNGLIATFAGTGVAGYSGDSGPATSAQLSGPSDIFAHPDGSIWIADIGNARIRRVGPDGKIRTMVGTGTAGYNGDNRAPLTAQLNAPQHIFIDATGTKLYINDAANYRIRLVPIPVGGAPQAPVMGQVAVGNREAMVSFAAPEWDGGTSISGYTVTSSPAGGVDADAGSTSLTHRITGLTNGTSYTFTVKGTTMLGTSPASASSAAVVPLAVPTSPAVTGLTRGDQFVTVAFAPPSDAGSSPITGYQVIASPAAGTDQQAGSTSLSHTVGGLVNGVSYTFTVRATNALGAGLPSAPSAAIAPIAIPSAPLAPQVQAGDGQVSLSWTQPVNWGTGANPSGFRVTASPGGAVKYVSPFYNTNLTFDGLQNGVNYTFSIVAMNDFGDSPAVVTNAVAPRPTITINDASIVEGNSGTQQVLTFDISLSHATTVPVAYDLRTVGGNATAGVDYVAVPSFRQTIPAGQTSAQLSVTINGDNAIENAEIFYVDVQRLSGAAPARNLATGKILNDDWAALSIADASVVEGNDGTKLLSFTVRLSGTSPFPVSYDLRTVAGTATADVDYVSVPSFRQTIPAGQTSATLSVTINGDATVEADELFYVDALHLTNAVVGDNLAVGKIVNDDFPALSIGDASVSEGDSGTKLLNFPITLSQAAIVPASFDLRTVAASATADVDYVSVPSFRMTIPAGKSSATLSVTINGDTSIENDEIFYVDAQQLSGAVKGDNVATGTILNDDPAGPTLSIGDASIAEGNSLTRQLVFTVTLSKPAAADVSYSIATADGTATAPGDYLAKSVASVVIPAGTTSKTFGVTIKGDTLVEPNETFTVNITGVVGAVLADGQGVGTILNDDGSSLGIARFDAGGLFDDIDDGHREPLLAPKEYALLLQDAASRLCGRIAGAAVVAVDDVENPAVLADLADATTLACGLQPPFAAVMAQGDSRGFLVQPSLAVLGKPRVDAQAKLTTLQLQAASGAITLVMPQALPADPGRRLAQLQALGNRVQSTLKADARARLVLIGGVTVPGLVDLTQRSLPADARLPAERVLLSPALLQEFPGAKVEFPAVKAGEAPAQVLRLKP